MIKGKEGNLLLRLKVKVTAVGEGGGHPGEAGYITSSTYVTSVTCLNV
jgi:hypothetical protein